MESSRRVANHRKISTQMNPHPKASSCSRGQLTHAGQHAESGSGARSPNGDVCITPPLKVQGPTHKRRWKRWPEPEMVGDSKEKPSSKQTGLMYIRTHGNYDNTDKPCPGSHQTTSRHGEKEVSTKSHPQTTVFATK